jgi:DNA adenine methylase
VGAGAVLCALQPAHATICDKNELLITTYQVIRDDVEGLIVRLNEHAQQHNAAYYTHIRALDRHSAYQHMTAVDKAARLIYLNRTCYNGLYRVNSRGYFNVPIGRYLNPLICDSTTLRAMHTYLHQAATSPLGVLSTLIRPIIVRPSRTSPVIMQMVSTKQTKSRWLTHFAC